VLSGFELAILYAYKSDALTSRQRNTYTDMYKQFYQNNQLPDFDPDILEAIPLLQIIMALVLSIFQGQCIVQLILQVVMTTLPGPI